MKLTKAQLKELIKECLIEILEEGLHGGTAPLVEASQKRRVTKPKQNSRSQVAPHQAHSAGKTKLTPQLKNAVTLAAGNDSIMASVLADTAKTTLPRFMKESAMSDMLDGFGGGSPAMSQPMANDAASVAVTSSTPDELFGEENASRWADLAFAPNPRKSR